jgi:predicted transcriptional regulator with HTH domain
LGIEKANTVDMMRPLIIRSLRRSKIRKQVAEYLFDISPNGSYPSDIAYMINTTPINVIGALKGYKSMYRNEESLMGMDIIEQVKINNNFIIYRITDYGKKIMESFF